MNFKIIAIRENLLADICKSLQILSTPYPRQVKAIYGLLSFGKPVSKTTISESLGFPKGAVVEMIQKAPQTQTNENGDIVSFMGLKIPGESPTDHTLVMNKLKFHTWCVFDTFFIPSAIGKDADITSISPISQEEIKMKIRGGRLVDVEPSEATMSLIPLVYGEGTNVQSSFCCKVRCFISHKEGNQWMSENTNIEAVVVNVHDAFDIAQTYVVSGFKDTLVNGVKSFLMRLGAKFLYK